MSLSRKDLRKFGITIGAALLVIAIFVIFKQKNNLILLAIPGLFFLAATVAPGLLKPVYIVWMKLAFILGWLNTRFLLIVLFYLVLTPIGLMIKLFGIDLLERKINKDRKTYWKIKESPVGPSLAYKRQF
ncbi:MAG: SxtJ family membrane protein [Candidatus Omnitrophica bacterium]|jgi:multisubunit Na+/H+ antiporter MnhG subunit|nr:SxtJ family membrane protein [Candidatus Omnitrophota bacterium]